MNFKNLKIIVLPLLALYISLSCNSNKNIMTDKNLYYTVYKIDSLNNYYLLYVKKNDSLYKIVSKKTGFTKCEKIKINNHYKFKLHSIFKEGLKLNGNPVLLGQVDCIGFEQNTYICIERDSINDLHYADNIIGLCFIKN